MTDNGKALAVFDHNRALSQVAEGDVKSLVQRVDTAAMWPRDCTREQKVTIARLSLAYGLDPMLGELTIYQGKPWITIDGRLRLAHNSGKFQGITDDRPATEAEYKALRVNPEEWVLWYCAVKHADWIKPNGRFGRAHLKHDKNPIVGIGKAVPPDVQARKRALWSALRDPWQMQLPGVGESEAIAVEAPSPADAEAPRETHPSRGQLAAIHALVKELEWSEEQYRAGLAEQFGVTTASDLTAFQAQDLLDNLGAALENKAAEERAPELGQLGRDVFGDFPGEQHAEPPATVDAETGEIVTDETLPTTVEWLSDKIKASNTLDELDQVARQIKLREDLTAEERAALRQDYRNQQHYLASLG